MNLRIALPVLALLSALQCHAYEVHTHALVTKTAYLRADVGETFITLGIYGDDGALVLPKKYWDMYGNTEVPRWVDQLNPADPKRWERNLITDREVDPDRPIGWLLRGVIREDDIGRVQNISGSLLHLRLDNPFDDPWHPGLARPFHHFFDPVLNRALEAGVPAWLDPALKKSPDWVLGYVDSFASTPQIDSNRRNHFSLVDAKEAMWRALTGRRSGSSQGEFNSFDRAAYWSTAFRALGTGQHHIQDMAQPQHTRNDSHGGVPGLGDDSAYETRINNRVTQKELRRGLLGGKYTLPGIEFAPCSGALCAVMLNSYADYFTTSIGNVASGKGLADYSNRGFFTVGTNLLSNSYTLPANNVNLYTQVETTGENGRPIRLFLGSVPDLVHSPESNVKLTAESLFDTFLAEANGQSTFQLYGENYDDQARLLLPRAVAYSAGALKYFFRGQLKIDLPPEKVYAVEDLKANLASDGMTPLANAGFKSLKVHLRNTTAAITPPGGSPQAQATDPAGTLVAVLRYRRNACLKYPSLTGSPHLNSSGQLVWSESCRQPVLDASNPYENQAQTQPLPDVVVSNPELAGDIDALAGRDVVFTFPQALPFNALDVDLQVLYRGKLGTEVDGFAVGFEHISEPTFFSFDNFSDCSNPSVCTPSTTDPTCLLSAAVKLPFHNSQDSSPTVASVTNMAPGEFARVAFLTRTGMQHGIAPNYIEPVTNQVFRYDVHVLWTAVPETWPKSSSPQMRSPLGLSRPTTLPDQPKLLGWEARGIYPNCGAGTCFNFQEAQACTPIAPTALRSASITFVP